MFGLGYKGTSPQHDKVRLLRSHEELQVPPPHRLNYGMRSVIDYLASHAGPLLCVSGRSSDVRMSTCAFETSHQRQRAKAHQAGTKREGFTRGHLVDVAFCYDGRPKSA